MKICSSWVFLVLLTVFSLCGCNKSFLDKLPSTALVVPSTLADYQQLLDNTLVMTGTPLLGEVSADNFYLPYNTWQALDSRERNAYVWAADLYGGQGQVDDWDIPYQQVFYANVVLEGLAAIPVTPANRQQWESEQGSALFLRAYAFYNVAQLFAPPYDSATAAADPGIPLRLHANVTDPSIRASVAATYEQITRDLRLARTLLPAAIPTLNLNRPSQPAALALLARVYLSLRAYDLAGHYADSALQCYDSLIDYNTLDPQGRFPFSKLNAETIYQSNIVGYTQCLAAIAYPNTIIDSTLYGAYSPQDLRRALFYQLNANGLPNMKPGYAELVWPFTGLATDELFLTRAECAARAGRVSDALGDLNTLLQHRYASGTFTPVTAASPQQALDTILDERRKELPLRGLRWTDLRRLNKEGRSITITRQLNGVLYQLQPNSNLYTLPIPPDIINFNPNMMQNAR
ncbi:RagB/SusD family nutrient uptake outer membrane protein [Flavitalea sp. BT771]|uniref:RagB/SusD family nutrient uptake outer membrane protein n=1 Tax=Flavitalea sp. BT771 TaxID=3063329 RepID=UPI0026E1947D|nr:RagB/SusD family nutrient uptake outer membrane protein [Flavitalea sp. BT771]MDO6433312.1 RagB/SusD family nutrient uptake outer membrane protein [Flavitalea sp. BT771]MDV6222783.1 RagB/SusD family nutrient uptake outer membrane protein [Flavitalea sp. BT771]